MTLDGNQFTVTDPDKFSPSVRILNQSAFALNGRGVVRCIQNASATDKAKNIYRPRLTVTKNIIGGRNLLSLRIEFSAPKLIFGNNFDEVSDSDYQRIKHELSSHLLEMGIQILGNIFDHVKISAIHYSKNFPFIDGTTASMILRDLAKINLNSRLDLNKTDYRNDGHAVRYHANSYEVVFYDKIKDLEQASISKKRAIEFDSPVSSDWFKQENFQRGLEITRMEVRLGNRKKIKELFKKLGINAGLTLGELFCQNISRKILLHFWNSILSEYQWISSVSNKPEDILSGILKANSKMRPTSALQILGAQMVINSVGFRGLKSIFGKQSSRAWQRLKIQLEETAPDTSLTHCFYGKITKSLIDFLPVKMHIYKISREKFFDYERPENQRTIC